MVATDTVMSENVVNGAEVVNPPDTSLALYGTTVYVYVVLGLKEVSWYDAAVHRDWTKTDAAEGAMAVR